MRRVILLDLFLRAFLYRTGFEFSEFSFQAAMDVSGHSLKKMTFKHKYARQILAVDLISHCQTKECFNIGHSCIIIADPYIMSSVPCFTIWDGGKRQSCQYFPGERHNSSRQ